MDVNSAGYQNVRSRLQSVANLYLNYILSDESLTTTERRKLFDNGVRTFSRLANIYEDPDTLIFLHGYWKKNTNQSVNGENHRLEKSSNRNTVQLEQILQDLKIDKDTLVYVLNKIDRAEKNDDVNQISLKTQELVRNYINELRSLK